MTDGLAWLRPYMKRPAPRVAGSADVRSAVDRYNADHRRTWGAAGSGDCPICGHRACFGEARGKLAGAGRWACFSANHGNIGVRLGACVHGDALDVDAFQAGRTRVEHLRALGYLTAASETRSTATTDTPNTSLGRCGVLRLTRADVARALGHDPNENEREFLDERAAIRCFDGGQSIEDAERGALSDLLRIIERERQARHA